MVYPQGYAGLMGKPTETVSFWPSLRQSAAWLLFLGATAVLLRPILLTAVSADDLINPFSQMYHAGTSPGPIWRRVVESVSITGHFNYVGQFLGSLAVLIWGYLISDFSIRYSLVYAATKYVVYVGVILLMARYARIVLQHLGVRVHAWPTRIATLLLLALTLQIHIPWSNDPVASYPLAGFGTALVGLLFLLLAFETSRRPISFLTLTTGVVGALAVLYYEFNAFAILGSAIYFVYAYFGAPPDLRRFKRDVLRLAISVGPAALTTIYFYFNNRAASANYSGTAVTLDGRFATTFRNGIIGSLPGSGWGIADDWLATDSRLHIRAFQYLAIGLILCAGTLFVGRSGISKARVGQRVNWRTASFLTMPVVVYWLGATFTQTATKKVQDEAARIGQVYNFYAIGAVAVALVVSVVIFAVDWRKLKIWTPVVACMVFLALGAYQYHINWNVTLKFNQIMTPTRELLVAFAEQPPMTERCLKLDQWKAMGWPEYYWLDLELGMNLMYRVSHQQEFCQR